MVRHDSDRLVEFLREKAGPALRVVARYDGDSYEFRFTRDDIESQYSRAELRQHVESFRMDENVGNALERDLHAGDHHCSLRVFDETVILNFTQGAGVGTIISLEPTAGRDLLSFITEALRVLNTTDEQIKSKPNWL
jgi:hypothetical protein